jgi:hypothetical protein
MKQSESIQELATALAAAQAEMGGAVKDSANPFFKSSYADLTSIIKVLKEPFANHGLSYVQFPIISDGGKGMGVSTKLMHKSGEWLESEFYLPMSKIDAQGAGSCVTYARRYALQAMAGIPAVDDDAEAAMLRTEPTLPDGVPNEQPKKRVSKKLVQGVVATVVAAEASGETSELMEALGELESHEKEAVWGQLTTAQKTFIRELKGM